MTIYYVPLPDPPENKHAPVPFDPVLHGDRHGTDTHKPGDGCLQCRALKDQDEKRQGINKSAGGHKFIST